MYLAWELFLAFVLTILLLDVGLLHRRAKAISLLEALVWSGFWMVLGLGFSVIVYLGYTQHWFDLALTRPAHDGAAAAMQYLSIYLIALTLNLEHAFAMRLDFDYFKVPPSSQTRALNWGITYALVWRSLIILAAAWVWIEFDWAHFLLGGLALFGAFRLLVRKADQVEPDKHLLVRLLQRANRIDNAAAEDHFVTRRGDKRMATPLSAGLLSVIAIETSFAVGTGPALYALSPEPLIVFSAVVLACAALRSMYYVVLRGMRRLRYLRITLVLLLVLLGADLLLGGSFPGHSALSLLVIVLTLGTGILASLLSSKRAQGSYMPGFAQELGRLYDLTYLGLRRIVILVLGISVIIVGVLLIFTPGPAIIVIPAGLAILATEFVWARLILRKFKEQFVRYSKETRHFFERNKRSNDDSEDSGKP